MHLFKTLKKINESASHKQILFFNYCLTNLVKGKKRVHSLVNFRKLFDIDREEIFHFLKTHNNIFYILEDTVLRIEIEVDMVWWKTEKVVPKTTLLVESEEKIIDEILMTLNKVTGKNFRLKTKAHRKHIRARLREGFEKSDFEHVIRLKAMEWLNTPQNLYLRPETLFGNKMDGYLNQQISTQNESKLNAINRAIHEAIHN